MSAFSNKRRARVALRNNQTPADLVKEVSIYLPANYRAFAIDGEVWIEGYDDYGWTLDGYVLPRLASGLIAAREVEVQP